MYLELLWDHNMNAHTNVALMHVQYMLITFCSLLRPKKSKRHITSYLIFFFFWNISHIQPGLLKEKQFCSKIGTYEKYLLHQRVDGVWTKCRINRCIDSVLQMCKDSIWSFRKWRTTVVRQDDLQTLWEAILLRNWFPSRLLHSCFSSRLFRLYRVPVFHLEAFTAGTPFQRYHLEGRLVVFLQMRKVSKA